MDIPDILKNRYYVHLTGFFSVITEPVKDFDSALFSPFNGIRDTWNSKIRFQSTPQIRYFFISCIFV